MGTGPRLTRVRLSPSPPRWSLNYIPPTGTVLLFPLHNEQTEVWEKEVTCPGSREQRAEPRPDPHGVSLCCSGPPRPPHHEVLSRWVGSPQAHWVQAPKGWGWRGRAEATHSLRLQTRAPVIIWKGALGKLVLFGVPSQAEAPPQKNPAGALPARTPPPHSPRAGGRAESSTDESGLSHLTPPPFTLLEPAQLPETPPITLQSP